MFEDTANIAALSVSSDPRADEAKEVSVASFSAPVRLISSIRIDQTPAPRNASGRETERSPEIVYLTRKRDRTTRLIDPVEDSLYRVLGYLLIAFLDL
jgi:hypothetical protein